MKKFYKWLYSNYSKFSNTNNVTFTFDVLPMIEKIGYLEHYLADNGIVIGSDSKLFIKMRNGEHFAKIRFDELIDVIEHSTILKGDDTNE